MLFSIKFKLRNQNYNPKTNLTPINVRLSVNGFTCTDFFSGVRCNPQKWNQKLQRIDGTKTETYEDNATLENVRTDLKRIINNLKEGETVHHVRALYLAKNVPAPTLLECFEKYIKEEKEKQNLNVKTVEKWYYSLHHLEGFVSKNFRLDEIKKDFGKKYFNYLVEKGTMSVNHALRNVSYFNSVLEFAVDNNFIERKVLAGVGVKKTPPKDIIYLDDSQLLSIENMQTEGVFMEVVDLFLFICYTSLDNNELRRLNFSHLQDNVIQINRGKTKQSLQIIPILPKARKILEKYNNELPVHQTYTLNRYLKVIKGFLNLPEQLTTKVGRKTAGMFFLLNDVPLEVVSRILGHKSIVTTQTHYANVLDKMLILKKTKHLM